MPAVSARYDVACPTCGAEPSTPCRARVTGRVTDTHLARVEGYQPRRARPRTDDELVLDEHQRLLVAIEQQATDWMSDALTLQERGAHASTVNGYRAHAEQLRSIARAHSRRTR